MSYPTNRDYAAAFAGTDKKTVLGISPRGELPRFWPLVGLSGSILNDAAIIRERIAGAFRGVSIMVWKGERLNCRSGPIPGQHTDGAHGLLDAGLENGQPEVPPAEIDQKEVLSRFLIVAPAVTVPPTLFP